MSILDRLLKRNVVSKISNTVLIEEAIDIYFSYDEYDQVWDDIEKLTTSRTVALMLFAFIPEIFCRLYLPNVNHSPYYIMKGHNNDKEYKFKDNDFYNELYQVISGNWHKYQTTADILKVAGTSAKIHAVNNLLLKNPIAQLDNIITSPMVIVNP